VVTDDVALESMTEAFQALTTDYRLSLLYLAKVITIRGPRSRTAQPVTLVADRIETNPPLLTVGPGG
jgi:hypothetical protein